MDLDKIRQVLELAREHELAEIEVEQEGLRLKIRRDHAVTAGHAAVPQPLTPVPAGGLAAAGPVSAIPGTQDAPEEVELAVVKSPIVGTFYRSPEPGAAPFVEVGSIVKKGQVLCIIEAMKLMNEIDSEYDGEIVRVYVESGHAVQYGERLFAIKGPVNS